MYLHLNIQDIIQCDLVKPPYYIVNCDVCYVNLCKPCIGEYISDGYDNHKIVPFEQADSSWLIQNANLLQSKQSNECICTLCSASNQVKGHDTIVLANVCLTKKNDIEELEENVSKIRGYCKQPGKPQF